MGVQPAKREKPQQPIQKIIRSGNTDARQKLKMFIHTIISRRINDHLINAVIPHVQPLLQWHPASNSHIYIKIIPKYDYCINACMPATLP